MDLWSWKALWLWKVWENWTPDPSPSRSNGGSSSESSIICACVLSSRWQRRSAWRCWSGFFHWVNLPSNWWWGSSGSLGDFVELFHFRPRWTTRRSSWCSTSGFSFDPSWHPSHTPSPATFRELEARTRVLHLRCNPPMQLRFRREREALSLEQPRTLQKRESGAGSSPW